MTDLVFLLVVAGFFATAVGFVRVCDRIVGRDESSPLGVRPADVTAGSVPANGTEP